ncbi:unnamed protein product [Spirodela intermedia]|uniref:Uncharacterized protein n=1 Tax=Spirodela intermedia TaxID=51605 RepID=A0A7I8JRW4_SPIIN|nr:unnamed protein product [Spirodela intermedia]CAA6672864.1 unnamed protein product [Spirodela intermedia]
MLKNSRCLSRGRKPLSDISNGDKISRACKQEANKGAGVSPRDRLLLARADLSKLVSEIDELFILASEDKSRKDEGTQEVESFIRLVSDMRSSLKVNGPRCRQHFPTDKPDSHVIGERNCVPADPELDLIVSSSPLVSWRNGACTIESGRQLFLLTPLHKLRPTVPRFSESSKLFPKWKKHGTCSVSALPDVEESTYLESTVAPTAATLSALKTTKDLFHDPNPSVKISPLKTCSLLGSASASLRRDNKIVAAHRGTPWTAAKSTQMDDASSFSGPSSSGGEEEITRTLTSKYPELFGLQLAHNPFLRKKEVDETLDWFLSPQDLRPLGTTKPEIRGSRRAVGLEAAATPAWRSTGKGKNAGEATLKRELWTKFEAVSTKGLQYDRSVLQQISRNRFLDMLEEVS